STGFLKNSDIEMNPKGYIKVNELMETNIEGVYAVGDNRVKYLRQVVTAAGDGATAAVAAERYIEELNSFKENVLESEQKVLLLFFNAQNNESLEFQTLLEEANKDCGEKYKIVKVDLATKKKLAQKYAVDQAPAVIMLDKGEVIKQLECVPDKEKVKLQLVG
ncbi:MAG: FAD-dependent oxidoreductase, partial [Clostridia bacterium]|nr:FAD-dependent oxidoreductase [Clostridia bacterium]